MNELKLLIADSSEDFCREVTALLDEQFQIRICCDGVHAQELLNLFAPDILVVDLLLPGLDGFTLLQRSAEQALHPVVLATTGYCSSYMADAAERMGISYIMRKPCRPDACAERIRDIARQLTPSPAQDPDPRTRVSNLLLQMGFSAKLKGYGFLREAILLFARDTDQLVTKELYPAVAEIFSSSGERVERAIRSAIKSAWEIGAGDLWRYFFTKPDGSIPCPTNGEFIARLADHLLVQKELSEKS